MKIRMPEQFLKGCFIHRDSTDRAGTGHDKSFNTVISGAIHSIDLQQLGLGNKTPEPLAVGYDPPCKTWSYPR